MVAGTLDLGIRQEARRTTGCTAGLPPAKPVMPCAIEVAAGKISRVKSSSGASLTCDTAILRMTSRVPRVRACGPYIDSAPSTSMLTAR